MRVFGLFLCLLAATGAVSSARRWRAGPVQERRMTYTNPVYDRDFPDPFVLRHGGKFYAYATETRGYRFQVMESEDLVHWTHRGTAFTVPWAQAHFWAPEVVYHRGRFYMTYSALNPQSNKHDIGIATADNPLGPFTHAAILVRGDDNRVGVIDATIFFDVDVTPYLVYSEEDPRRIVLRRMSPDLLSVEDEVTELIRPDLEWERGITEAPTLLRRNGLYHLFYSGGHYQGSKQSCRYAVGHAVARSLRGPYQKASRPLLETVEGRVYGPGHQCVVRLPDGAMWMVYHGWDDREEPRYGSNPAGRTMRIDRIVWRGDTPRVEGPTFTPQPAPKIGPRP